MRCIKWPIVGAGLVLSLCAGLARADDAIQTESAGMEVARQLKAETRAAVELHVTSMHVEHPPEMPNRLQEYVVEGVVKECFKGPLQPGAKIKYYAATEGRSSTLENDHIAFLQRSKADKRKWSSVEGIAFPDTPELKAGIHRMFGDACTKPRVP